MSLGFALREYEMRYMLLCPIFFCDLVLSSGFVFCIYVLALMVSRRTSLMSKMEGCSSRSMKIEPTRLCWQAKLSLSPKLSLYLTT